MASSHYCQVNEIVKNVVRIILLYDVLFSYTLTTSNYLTMSYSQWMVIWQLNTAIVYFINPFVGLNLTSPVEEFDTQGALLPQVST